MVLVTMALFPVWRTVLAPLADSGADQRRCRNDGNDGAENADDRGHRG